MLAKIGAVTSHALLEERMKNMRDRYNNLLDDDDPFAEVGELSRKVNASDPESRNSVVNPLQSTSSKAKNRWSTIKQAVRHQTLPKDDTPLQRTWRPAGSVIPEQTAQGSQEESSKELTPPESAPNINAELATQNAIQESEILLQFWENAEIPAPEWASFPGGVKLEYPSNEEYKDSVDTGLTTEGEAVQVVVSRVPTELLETRKKTLEENIILQKANLLEAEKAKAVDIIWREHQARERILQLEKEATARISIERQKLTENKFLKEKEISRRFRGARSQLEEGIKAQEASIVETYGIINTRENSLSRKYFIRSRHFPQPIEMRIHLLRAIKTKLPKGAYLLMLTQYESLGGKPLSWSKSGLYGIGDSMPAVTHPVKHYGRYFDRTLRVEDSCFALCPPSSQLKPSFVFVVELFQLANRTCPDDRVVAWTAIPMCGESLGHIEGKYKLGMVRGEHTPSIRHFKTMERCISDDLNNWLCNIYLEIKHMPLSSIEQVETEHGLLQYDFVRKSVASNRLTGDDEGADQPQTNLDIEADGGWTKEQNAAQLVDLQVDAGLFQRKHRLGGVEGVSELGSKMATMIKIKPTEINTANGFSKVLASNVNLSSGDSGDDSPIHAQVKKKNGKRSSKSVFGPFRKMLSGVSGIASSRTDPHDVYRFESGHGISIEPSGEEAPLLSDPAHSSDKQLDRNVSLLARAKNSGSGSFDGGRNKIFPLENDVEFSDDDDVDEDGNKVNPEIHVIERGYRAQDEFFLDNEQKGRLIGVDSVHNAESKKWAQATIEENGTVQRRFQSEGPRLDSEALDSLTAQQTSPHLRPLAVTIPSNKSDGAPPKNAYSPPQPQQLTHENASSYLHRLGSQGSANNINPVMGIDSPSKDATSKWTVLESAEEMDLYTPAVASDPSQRKRLLPGAIAKSKLRYLFAETFGELSYYMWGTFDFYVTLVVYLIALWFRMYLHYIAEYLYLLALRTPVYGFGFELYQVSFKYMSSSISIGAEIGVVAIGPLANIIVFIAFMLGAKGFYKFAGFLPKGLSQFTLSYGVACILDPLLVAIVDLCKHNFNCQGYSGACKASYTKSNCHCFIGDFAKLWVRMQVEEGSGLTGLLLVIIIYGACFIISCFAVYEYLVYIHHDGKILDIWRRIHGQPEDFLLPDDFEISYEELHSICIRAAQWRGINGASRKLIVSNYVEHDPLDPSYEETTRHYAIYEIDGDKKSIYRHFLRLPNGAILEVFDQFANVHANKYQALHKLLNIDQSLPQFVRSSSPVSSSHGPSLVPAAADSSHDLAGEATYSRLHKQLTGDSGPSAISRIASGNSKPDVFAGISNL